MFVFVLAHVFVFVSVIRTPLVANKGLADSLKDTSDIYIFFGCNFVIVFVFVPVFVCVLVFVPVFVFLLVPVFVMVFVTSLVASIDLAGPPIDADVNIFVIL